MGEASPVVDYATRDVPHDPSRDVRGPVRDDLAYLLPMAAFMAFTWVGGQWRSLYPLSYLVKVIVVALMLMAFRRLYTRIRWDYWWLGILVGIIGIFQWVPMQLWLQHHLAFFKPPGEKDVFNPFRDLPEYAVWTFIGIRVFGAVVVVPFMEELFWRDFLWRQVLAPNDFKLARVGEWAWAPFLIVSGAFSLVHGNWWLTAIVWAMMIGALLVYTKSLGACIIAHAVTNLLLAVYVLRTHDWAFW
jgi:CAAX prenyl protease-like protein